MHLEEWPILRADPPPFSLELCLESGQSFAWTRSGDEWRGTIGNTAFALRPATDGFEWRASFPGSDAVAALRKYFTLAEDHRAVLRGLPRDPFLDEAVKFCAGMRVLRQPPWECLAGFILSSTKQIIHIRQIWGRLCTQWGEARPLTGETEAGASRTFPSAAVLARRTEKELRGCGMGFRAPYLLGAARAVADGRLDLELLRALPTTEAREKLMALHGVGRKIADCVMLFSLDKSEAFPVDTWILKVLRRVYFRGRRKVTPRRLLEFASTHFGPHGGYAQQCLFHYARTNPAFRDGMTR